MFVLTTGTTEAEDGVRMVEAMVEGMMEGMVGGMMEGMVGDMMEVSGESAVGVISMVMVG